MANGICYGLGRWGGGGGRFWRNGSFLLTFQEDFPGQ